MHVPVLVDTSIILVRIANTLDPMRPSARNAIRKLRAVGEILHVALQNLIEFRSVATRPTAVNGLGFDAATASQQIHDFELTFSVLPETNAIYPAWKALVASAAVMGKQVHDARLIAVCQTYDITQVITFNLSHFNRLASFVPGLTVVDPANV